MRRLSLLALVLAACPQQQQQTQNGKCTKDCAIALQNVSVAENPLNVLSYLVDWTTAEEASTDVRVDCDGALFDESVDDTLTTAHHALITGLYAGAECTVKVTSRAADRAGQTEEAITVAELPAWLPPITKRPPGGATAAPGWTLFPLTNGTDHLPLAIVIVDEDARVRWYHRRAIAKPGEAAEVKATAEGVLVSGFELKTALIGWDGKVVWEQDLGAHHEIVPKGSDDFLLLRADASCPDGKVSDTVFQWHRPTNATPWTWRICDHYTPPVSEDDWSHANAIAEFPDEDAILVSLRNQSNLMKVNRATQALEWTLGDNGDFALAPADRFLRQHAARVLANGHILLFDNGLEGTRDYSRAIEIAYDVNAKTAQVVWEYRPTPDIFAKVWSDAERLTNGNTLVTFGIQNVTPDVTHIIEVDAAKREAWHVTFPPKWGVYRAHRIEALGIK